MHRLDNLRANICARIEAAKLIVENLAHDLGVTKDASGHGHGDHLIAMPKQSPDHDVNQFRQFSSGPGNNGHRYFVFASHHRGRQRREIRRRD